MILEVKGGAVSIEEGFWFSRNRNGLTHNIADPLSQARKGIFAALKRLNNLPHFSGRFINTGYAAILPQTLTWHQNICLPDLLFNLVIFREHVNEAVLPDKLSRIMKSWKHVWDGFAGKIDYFSKADIRQFTAAKR